MNTLAVNPRALVGSILIAFGSLLLIERLSVLPFELHFFDILLWLLVAFGLTRLFQGEWTSGAICLTIGAIHLGPRYIPGLEYGDIFRHWPLFLIALGVAFVFRGILDSGKSSDAKRPNRSGGPTAGQTEDSGSLAVFRTLDRIEPREDYRGDGIVALGSQIKLDLTETELAPEGATLDIFCMWSAVEVKVPRHWTVELKLQPFMGGAEDKTRPPGAIEGWEPRLVVTGFALMAGVEVTH